MKDDICYATFIGAVFLFGLCAGTSIDSLTGGFGDVERNTKIKYCDARGLIVSQQSKIYDVNGDGLDDIVDKEGNVLLTRINGGDIYLHDLAKKEISSIIEKYSLMRGQDGNYYTESGLGQKNY